MSIRKIAPHKYRIYSSKGKNLGTFSSKAGAVKHEAEVRFFKHRKKGK